MEKAPNGCNANFFFLLMILAKATPTSKHNNWLKNHSQLNVVLVWLEKLVQSKSNQWKRIPHSNHHSLPNLMRFWFDWKKTSPIKVQPMEKNFPIQTIIDLITNFNKKNKEKDQQHCTITHLVTNFNKKSEEKDQQQVQCIPRRRE